MIKKGLSHQATGVQLLMDTMERTPAKELPGLMQHLQKEFRPVGMTSHSAAPVASMSTPSSMMASTASAMTTSTTPKATIKAEHGDPFLFHSTKWKGTWSHTRTNVHCATTPPLPQSMPAEPVSTGIWGGHCCVQFVCGPHTIRTH